MDLAESARQRRWYHTMELAPDLTTDGWFDLRPHVDRYGLPESMEGMRALDVGTWDGFWAFEMERRGADVVALDLDDERDLDWQPRNRPETFPDEPRGAGFRMAHELLGSKVERINLSIYNATPEEIGQFDVVLCGNVLIHLRDQLLALERIANLCSGTFVTSEEYDTLSSLLPFSVARYRADRPAAVVFWQPSKKTWGKMLWTAGFDRVEVKERFTMEANDGLKVKQILHHAHKS
ncbi:MAG: methyltransferase domain-containing protein [Thermoleophilaceae bacterium]|nr:methyltransferase domain-containing protein [Thermoleophilaceae bacterium]